MEHESKTFLAEYKMVACQESNYHDARLCNRYHCDMDHRWNPFEKHYFPDES